VTEWWNGLTRQLLHPDAPLTGHQVLQGLDSVQILGMCILCQEITITWVKTTGALLKENSFVEEAVRELMDWQTDKLIRAHI
jgi:hypothetical protein